MGCTAKHWHQFDVIVKYWPEDCECILVQHLKSFNMGHANAEQLKANIMDALSGLYHDKLLQLSSDGPNELCRRRQYNISTRILWI